VRGFAIVARVAIIVLIVVAAALVAAQLGLPAIAEDRIADDLERLLLSPDGLFGAFATVTVFDDPRVRVEDLAATPVEGGIEVAVEGRLVEAEAD
jgi:hypothetical protein